LLVNELAQWAVLAGLLVFVLGLTRQLGNFLIPPRELAEESTGPALGERLSAALLPKVDRDRLIALMHERGSDWAAVVVVSGECRRCTDMLDRLRTDDMPGGAPVVGLSMTREAAHQRLLEQAVDIAVVDPEALDAEGVHVKPLIMIVDRALKVRLKRISPNLQDVARAYTRARVQGEVSAQVPADNGTTDELTIVKAGG
jgi:hypothetical protein